MNLRILLFFFLFSISIFVVLGQQNIITVTEPFSVVYSEINYSQLANTTKSADSTNSFMIFDSRRWYVGNLMGTEGQHPTNPNNVSSNLYWTTGSQLKLTAGRLLSSPTYDSSFLFMVFANSFDIKEDSYFSFEQNTTNQLDVNLVFLDQSNVCRLVIEGDDTGSSDFSAVNSYCQNTDYVNCAMDNRTPGLGVTGYGVNYSECGLSDVRNLKKLVIFLSEGGPGDSILYLDNLVLGNLYNGSNIMPSVNLTLDQDEFCMNGSYMQIPINITAFDPENDTVYYINGKAQFSYNQNETVVEFSDEVFGVGLLPDASKIENNDLLLTEDICGIENNWNEAYNTSAHNFVDWSHWLNPMPLWGLELNSNCSYYSNRSDYGLYYKITPMAGLSLKTRFAKWDGSDKLNISFYNIYRDELFSVEFRNYQANPGVTNVYHKNTWLGNMTNSQGDIMEFYISPMGFAYNVTVVGLLYGSKTFNITGNPYADQVRYIGFHVTGSSVLDEFKYQGVSYTYTFLDDVSQWTTDVPDHVNITYPGSYQIDIIYSDSEHYPGSSGTVSQNLKIYSEFECRYLDVDNVGIGTIDDHTTRTDPLGALAWLFGHGLVQFLNNTGYYEIGKILLWWIYIFMILILFFTTGRNSLSAPVLLSSIAVGFLALMVGYTSHFITSLIMIAVSLAGPFAKVFGGD